MIVDSSAIVEIIQGAELANSFAAALGSARAVMSAANYLEAGIVIDKARNAEASAGLDALLETLEVEIVEVTPTQARLARQAYRDFGKGSGHPAKLNFGDCFAYALAVERGEPLLFKGDDFTHTGIARA